MSIAKKDIDKSYTSYITEFGKSLHTKSIMKKKTLQGIHNCDISLAVNFISMEGTPKKIMVKKRILSKHKSKSKGKSKITFDKRL